MEVMTLGDDFLKSLAALDEVALQVTARLATSCNNPELAAIRISAMQSKETGSQRLAATLNDIHKSMQAQLDKFRTNMAKYAVLLKHVCQDESATHKAQKSSGGHARQPRGQRRSTRSAAKASASSDGGDGTPPAPTSHACTRSIDHFLAVLVFSAVCLFYLCFYFFLPLACGKHASDYPVVYCTRPLQMPVSVWEAK